METKARRIHLRPRLAAAADMLSNFGTVADIGCDHGRLIVSLLQQNGSMRGVASDVRKAPLKRAEQLAERAGVADRVSFRLGDGLSVLRDGEADAICLLGMGGTVMARMLAACDTELAGARLAVFQPMRAAADIRAYLFANGCRIVMDRVVLDAGRLYQVFAAAPAGPAVELPAGWPADCFDVGYAAYEARDPLLPALVTQMLAQHERRLLRASGTRGEALLNQKAAQMRTILRLMGEHE